MNEYIVAHLVQAALRSWQAFVGFWMDGYYPTGRRNQHYQDTTTLREVR
jgi:hypothetical protein